MLKKGQLIIFKINSIEEFSPDFFATTKPGGFKQNRKNNSDENSNLDYGMWLVPVAGNNKQGIVILTLTRSGCS